MNKKEAAAAKLKTAYDMILDAFNDLGYPVKTDQNFDETAARAPRRWASWSSPPTRSRRRSTRC